jgi:hypothetical protein
MKRAWLAIIRNPWMTAGCLCLIAGYISGVHSGGKLIFWSSLLMALAFACVLIHEKNYRRVIADLRDPRVLTALAAVALGYLLAFRISNYFFFWGFLLAALGYGYLVVRRNRAENPNANSSALNHIQR